MSNFSKIFAEYGLVAVAIIASQLTFLAICKEVQEDPVTHGKNGCEKQRTDIIKYESSIVHQKSEKMCLHRKSLSYGIEKIFDASLSKLFDIIKGRSVGLVEKALGKGSTRAV